MTNVAKIQEKSKKMQIPFDHLLAGFILEELVAVISQSQWKDELYVRNGHDLGQRSYERKIVKKLELSYLPQKQPGKIVDGLGESDLEGFAEVWKNALNKEHIEVTKYQVSVIKRDHRFLGQISLYLTCEAMYIPMEIDIYPQNQKEGFPRMEELPRLMEENRVLQYRSDSLEYMAAYHCYYIMKDLELINEMEHYLYLYELIQNNSLEGRRVKDQYVKLWQQNHLPSIEKRLDMIRDYGSYTYMIRKWKVLLRKEKRNDPQWKQVIDKIIKFLNPIYESILQDEIFFGDWMPELERYLE